MQKSCVTILIETLIWSVWSVALMATGEYLTHKYPMHKRLTKHPWFNWIFEDHVIAHHKDNRKDVNIDLSISHHLSVAFPLLAWLAWLSPIGLITTLLVFAFHSYAWTKVHRGIHGVEENWVMKTSIYRRLRAHHLEHHDSPSRNFGVVFPFTDLIFGTYQKPKKEHYL
jgi:sterol desaturase/sphingolipid hydroxylase (fatty acid hydroxylase superfamily)